MYLEPTTLAMIAGNRGEDSLEATISFDTCSTASPTSPSTSEERLNDNGFLMLASNTHLV